MDNIEGWGSKQILICIGNLSNPFILFIIRNETCILPVKSIYANRIWVNNSTQDIIIKRTKTGILLQLITLIRMTKDEKVLAIFKGLLL